MFQNIEPVKSFVGKGTSSFRAASVGKAIVKAVSYSILVNGFVLEMVENFLIRNFLTTDLDSAPQV